MQEIKFRKKAKGLVSFLLLLIQNYLFVCFCVCLCVPWSTFGCRHSKLCGVGSLLTWDLEVELELSGFHDKAPWTTELSQPRGFRKDAAVYGGASKDI